MEYKGFKWELAPKEIKITIKKQMNSYSVPKLGSRVESLGGDYREIEGKGDFCGDGCYKEFKALSKIFSQTGPGRLSISPLGVIKASFIELVIESSGPKLISYRFKFREEADEPGQEEALNEREIELKAGENMWDLASRYGLAIESLMELNPWLSDPYMAKEGEKVRLI